MAHLSCRSTKMRKFDKNIVIMDRQIYIVIAQVIKTQLHKIISQNIKKLVISTKVFFLKILSHKYLCYFIVKHFTLVI